MKELVKVALIGCGGIAFGKHLPALAALDNVQITAFCDIIEERAQNAAKQFGTPEARVFTDYRRLLAEADASVFHVCTPNRSHSPITVAALESGRHVLCEKPMAIDAGQAAAMLDAAKRTGKKLSIAYQNRHRPDAWFLKQACANGDLGEIYYAKAHALRRRAVPTWGVFLNEYEQGGGPLIDIGTHALDLTLWMMDNYTPRMVVGTAYKKLGDQKNAGNAWGDWDPAQFTVEDAAFGFIVMENGATIVLESSWALNTIDNLPLRHQSGRGYARRAAYQRRAVWQAVYPEARAGRTGRCLLRRGGHRPGGARGQTLDRRGCAGYRAGGKTRAGLCRYPNSRRHL